MASPGPERTVEQGGSGHPRVVTALLLVGTLLAFLAIFSIWVNRQALNTDNWVKTSDRLLQDEEIQAQLSNYLADELIANVDLQGELEGRFPPRLAPLAAPAAGALQQLAPQAAQRALETSQLESLWNTANRVAHERLLAVLNDSSSSNLATTDGEVTLDLSALLTQLTDRLGVGGKLVEKLPPDAGRLTILESDELSTAQDATTLVRRLPVVVTLLALLLYGLALYLAGPRRREALRSVGFGFLVAGVLALLLRKFAGVEVTAALSGSDSVEPAVRAAWDIGTSLLVSVAVSAITFGVLVVIAAWLAGPTRAATRLRCELAPHMRERGATYGAVALLFLALVLWAPVVAFQKPIGIVLLAVLMILGTEALRRQTAAEFPSR
jgi:hypothetical protein